MEYLYDKRTLIFNGLATQVNPLRTKQGEEYISKISFWRAPYLASFRSGNFDFVVLTTHIRWGDNLETRRAELQQLDWIEAKRKSEFAEDRDLIVMGDFNIPTANDACSKPSPVAAWKFRKPCAVLPTGATWKRTNATTKYCITHSSRKTSRTKAACSITSLTNPTLPNCSQAG